MLFSTPALDELDESAIADIDRFRRDMRFALREPKRWTPAQTKPAREGHPRQQQHRRLQRQRRGRCRRSRRGGATSSGRRDLGRDSRIPVADELRPPAHR